MEVGIVFTLVRYGGVQTCVISLIKGLNEKGIIPTIIDDEEPNPKIIEENNLRIKFEKIKLRFPTEYVVKQNNSVRYLLSPFNKINASKLKQKYDFFYIFRHNFINDNNTPYAYYLSGPPYLPQLNPQKGIAKWRFQFIQLLYKVILRPFSPVYEFRGNAETTVINSQFTSDLFFEAHGIRLDVVYPSNSFEINEQKGFEDKDGVVFLSRIVSYKRPEMVIELAKKHQDISFTIVGTVDSNQEVYYRSLVSLVEGYGLTNLKFIINEKFEVLQDVLKKAKFYVFPTINEHFGITTVEAIMSGTIPFVHNSGGQKEIVDIEALRFEDNEFFEKFDMLVNTGDEKLCEYQEHFYKRSAYFSEHAYNKRMLEYIQ